LGQGISLDCSTPCGWIELAFVWRRPLYGRVIGYVIAAKKIVTLKSTCPVLDPGSGGANCRF
jgi:hypothetical protein